MTATRASTETTTVSEPSLVKPSEREAFWFWLKLGCISFGGPAGQIAIMHDELVERRKWISERRFLHALNFCMALPGPEAQQLASYVGYSLYGVRGAITSGGLFVAPSFVLLCLMSGIYVEFGDVTVVQGIVSGLGAAVVALVAAAVLRVGGRVIHTKAAIGLATAAFAAIAVGVPFPVIIAVAALTGYLAGRSNTSLLGRPSSHGDDADDDPAEAHAGVSVRRRLIKGLVIWLVPVAVLVAIGGLVGELAGFFTLAALVTFGGAYAVLPFVANAAVNHYNWLTSKDMVAGLALGESTPGPLIMVNTFVGFVAGYHVEGNLAWGVLGATIATLATFVPCFVMIISGAPLIDRIRSTGSFANGLNGVTVSVVGVIAALAVFVARHALITSGRPDWVLTPLAAAAFIAVWRYRTGVIPVVLTCAAAGIANTYLR